MRAFNATLWKRCSLGSVMVLGTSLGWPSYALRELLNALSLALLFFVLLLISLYLLGASADHPAEKTTIKLGAVPKVLSHASYRLEATRKRIHPSAR